MFGREEVIRMPSITVDELHASSGTPLIDVREAHEFAAGHVPGAINLPMSTLGEHLDELPDGAFDVICQVGGRSAQVVEALRARGFDAIDVAGGTSEWAARGYGLER